MFDGYNVGYMTYDEFNRFRRSVNYSMKLVPWLRVAGYIKTGDPDEIRGKSVEPPLGIPPTWLAAEEITQLSQALNRWRDLEDVAADDGGFELALIFTREVETAAAKWPFEDRAHRVQFVRCPACRTVGLRYEPPTFEGDPISVKCRECHHHVSEQEFARLTALIAIEFAEAKEKTRERRLGDRRTGNDNDGQNKTDDLQVGSSREGGNTQARTDNVA